MQWLAIALLTLTLGCGLRTNNLAGMTQEETKQTPVMGMLGRDGEDGIFFGFQFKSRDLTEQEDFRLLAAVIARIDQLNADPTTEFEFNYTGKVVIFAYEGKTVDVAATADFGSNVVELWTGYRGKDWYVKKTYEGDPQDILAYLKDGVAGQPKIEEGKVSEETKQSFGKKTDCRLPMHGTSGGGAAL